jgi:uncharacterized NAD-dependent epimerase/dehydratase family protein
VTIDTNPPPTRQTFAILAEGQFGFHHGKTAMGVIRYGPHGVAAVIDSEQAGRNVREWLGDDPRFDIPIVASLGEALALEVRPTALLIGIAPTGGQLPAAWRTTILEALEAGLDVHSGLHSFLGDDPEFAAQAAARGASLVDYRRPPDVQTTALGRGHGAGKRVILTVGTDCAIGKMSVALELTRAAAEDGLAGVFVPTGQTGMMIAGWGVAVDRLISDFTQGVVENLVAEGETRGDWLLVEGQGSLDHPAYSSVTLGLIHGATPHAMVLVHKPGLADHDFDHLPDRRFPIAPLPQFIDLHERVAGLVAPSRVVAVALNTMLIPDPDAARTEIRRTAELTGLPVDDPVRFGPGPLWAEIRRAVERLPWVADEVGAGSPSAAVAR